MGPVGPETWEGVPPNSDAQMPTAIAPYMPAAAPFSMPEAMPNPSARGSATMPAVRPPKRSPRMLERKRCLRSMAGTARREGEGDAEGTRRRCTPVARRSGVCPELGKEARARSGSGSERRLEGPGVAGLRLGGARERRRRETDRRGLVGARATCDRIPAWPRRSCAAGGRVPIGRILVPNGPVLGGPSVKRRENRARGRGFRRPRRRRRSGTARGESTRQVSRRGDPSDAGPLRPASAGPPEVANPGRTGA